MKATIGCWQIAEHPPQLPPGQIDLWRFRVDLPEQNIESLQECLSEDELQRAARLLIAAKRRQFIAARASLRMILARYLGCTAKELVFCYGPQGKPELLHNPDGYRFNLAHSGAWGVLAVTRSGEVGVDLEQINNSIKYLSLADKFFSAAEIVCLQNISTTRRRRTFYRLWTRKESFLKQTGCGFSGVAAGREKATASANYFFVPARNYLGSVSFSFEITLINRLQLTE